MMKRMKNNLGYTLGEIVMTTAIIGSLATIAVPNYLRIKMNVNMEMVKQQLRILGQNMNELYNQNNPHQYPEDIQNLDGNPAEELAITASLNSLGRMGYELEHFTPEDGSTFLDIARPQPGQEGISGTDCYGLDPMGLHDRKCWDAEGIDMFIMESSTFSASAFSAIFSDPSLSESDKISILSGMFIQFGLYVDFFVNNIVNISVITGGFDPAKIQSATGLPAFFASMNESDKPAFEQLIEKVIGHLQASGVQIYLTEDQTIHPSTGELMSGIKVAVQLDQSTNFNANEDAKAYKDYIMDNSSTLAYKSQTNELALKDGTEMFLVGENCYHCA